MTAQEKVLTIGIPTFQDFEGLWMTVQALRLYHAEALQSCQIVVVDDSPDTQAGQLVRDFLGSWFIGPALSAAHQKFLAQGYHDPEAARLANEEAAQTAVYVKGPAAGPAKAKDKIFEHAACPYVLVLDSHVLLVPGSLDRLLAYYREHPDTNDLLQGPLLYDNLVSTSSSFSKVWRGEMLGTWQDDGEKLARGEPFEIDAQGMGLFSCRKAVWPGFPKDWKGFAPEEHIAHELIRQQGGKCLCLPWLQWNHRFGRTGGARYPLSRFDKVRNYVIGFKTVGWDVAPIYRHFVALDHPGETLAQHVQREHSIDPRGKTEVQLQEAHKSSKIPQVWWDAILAGAQEPPKQQAATGCGGCGTPQQVPSPPSLEVAYRKAADTKSDINEHVPTLAELAKGCDVVVELGTRTGVSTTGLLYGQPKELYSYDTHPRPEAAALLPVAGNTKLTLRQGDSREVDIPECDLLFVDTIHTADHVYAELTKHASKVRKRIAFHDTVIFGEHGEYGKPGLLPAIRRFLKENPEWTVIRHDRNNHGFLVISRDPADKKELPPLWKQGWNFLGAVGRAVKDGWGNAREETVTKRLELCTVCPSRNGERCAECGCYLDKKTSWPKEFCPLGNWAQEEEVKDAA